MFTCPMTFTTLLSCIFLLLGTSFASSLPRQPSSDSCSAFPGTGLLNIHNFTLAALNTTLPNANTTGAPIILGSAGAVDGAEFFQFQTQSTYHYPPSYPWLNLTDGGLTASEYVSGTAVFNNSVPGFIATLLDPPTPAQIYCSVETEGYDYSLLAVNGHTNLFTVCTAYPCDPPTDSYIQLVYYNISQSTSSCTPADCYPVVLSVVPA